MVADYIKSMDHITDAVSNNAIWRQYKHSNASPATVMAPSKLPPTMKEQLPPAASKTVDAQKPSVDYELPMFFVFLLAALCFACSAGLDVSTVEVVAGMVGSGVVAASAAALSFPELFSWCSPDASDEGYSSPSVPADPCVSDLSAEKKEKIVLF